MSLPLTALFVDCDSYFAGLAAVALNPGIIDTRMLRSCFGEGAASYPTPEEWAESAVPYLASLDTRHNGMALTVPGM